MDQRVGVMVDWRNVIEWRLHQTKGQGRMKEQSESAQGDP